MPEDVRGMAYTVTVSLDNKGLARHAEVEASILQAPDEVTKSFRKMLDDLDKGLPRATSGEVLSSQVKW